MSGYDIVQVISVELNRTPLVCQNFPTMAGWLVLLSALCLLAGSSAHSRSRLAARSETNTAMTSSGIITDPASYVNVFIGTIDGRHVFPDLLL